MTIRAILKAVYAVLGAVYLFVGVGALLLPTGWLPVPLASEFANFYAVQAPDSFLSHLTQEFGTAMIALGLVFAWQAWREHPSRSLHWLLTIYLLLDALVHWVGPQGLIGAPDRALIDSVPPLLMLVLGVLRRWQYDHQQ
ncbi:MAG TPA: hypothetical protein VMH83_05630 [Candidatus Acidoferrum sp.]|nr:hypothetical protein [Candidatus Acidoferrum sp.]